VKSTFRISRVYDDGSEADTLIVPVTALPAGIRMDRRVFFRAGVTLSGVAAILTAAGHRISQQPRRLRRAPRPRHPRYLLPRMMILRPRNPRRPTWLRRLRLSDGRVPNQ
jgi:hypothetical protein